MKFIRIIVLLNCLLILSSCASKQKRIEYKKLHNRAHSENNCTLAQVATDTEFRQERIDLATKELVGKTVIFGATPLAIYLDILILVVACRNSICNDIEFFFTEALWKNSRNFRCPSRSYYLEKIVSNTECFLTQENEKSNEVASLLIKELREQLSETFNCLTPEDENKIKKIIKYWKLTANR